MILDKYPLVNSHITNWKITIFNGKIHVYTIEIVDFPIKNGDFP